MNDLRSFSDHELLNQIQKSVADERKAVAYVVLLLEEVDLRKVYLKRGFGSLLEFCVKELKYSESSAYRRISAMRVCRDLPRTQEKIIDGTLSLSVLSQAQTFIRQEEKHTGARLNTKAKEDLLKVLENTSSREAEKILIEKSPNQARPEKIRAITEKKSELRLTLDESTIEKLDKIKSLISHKNPNISYSELIDVMAEMSLERLDHSSKEVRKRKAAPTQNSQSLAQIKRDVWRKSKGQCCFVDYLSKRRCTSRFQLQIDHILPKSRGGLNKLENLQLLCREHNQMKGFGFQKLSAIRGNAVSEK